MYAYFLYTFVTQVSTILKNFIMISCDSSYRITQCDSSKIHWIRKKVYTEFFRRQNCELSSQNWQLHATCTQNVNTYHLIQFEYVQFYLHNDYEMSRFIFVYRHSTNRAKSTPDGINHTEIYIEKKRHICAWFV